MIPAESRAPDRSPRSPACLLEGDDFDWFLCVFLGFFLNAAISQYEYIYFPLYLFSFLFSFLVDFDCPVSGCNTCQNSPPPNLITV